MRRALILSLFAGSLFGGTAQQVAPWVTVASGVDSIFGAHIQKSAGNALKKAGRVIAKPFLRKPLPNCLDVQGPVPCKIKVKH